MIKHYIKNTVTGRIWSRERGFAIAPMAITQGDLVDAAELAVLRATYDNVAVHLSVKLPDPVTPGQEAANYEAFAQAAEVSSS